MKKLSILFFIGVAITSTSQLYLNFIVDGFRVSTAVILLPILLITYSKVINPLAVGIVTGTMIFFVRISILVIRGANFFSSVTSVFPASLFYIVYCIIFKANIKKGYSIDYDKVFLTILMSDYISNIIEVGIRLEFRFYINGFNFYIVLLFIAMTRATIAYAILLIIRHCKNLLANEEHEKRYQNIVLLISDLKSEIYFMRKNIDNIENVMSNAYRLYEDLSTTNLNNNLKKLSLKITKDIHELKKDYIRVISGIELTLTDKLEVEYMSLSDILYILNESTYRILMGAKNNIDLDFSYEQDFTTKQHYQLMSILTNLVNNAIEAIGSSYNNGMIQIIQQVDNSNSNYIFYVIDNGPGIAVDDLEYIFDPGFSTKYDYKTGDIYRGVGLTNVKYLVEEFFNGCISVSSNQKSGTTFEIIIPKRILGD